VAGIPPFNEILRNNSQKDQAGSGA